MMRQPTVNFLSGSDQSQGRQSLKGKENGATSLVEANAHGLLNPDPDQNQRYEK